MNNLKKFVESVEEENNTERKKMLAHLKTYRECINQTVFVKNKIKELEKSLEIC